MSSSNPFRRAQPTDRIESSAASVASEAPPLAASLDFPSEPSSTSKKVRISSPPQPPLLSPPTPHPSIPVQRDQSDSDDRTLPDLPSQSGQLVTDAADPFDAISSSGDEAQSTDTERMSESVGSIRPVPGMPPNPFMRTLATIEEPWRSSQPQEQLYEPAEPSRTEKKPLRASMDVNAFKNLLMTGKATPNVPGASFQTKPPSLTIADNSSSTDTSSISRHSLSELTHELASETPRTSYEQSLSEYGGDDNAQLLQGSQRHDRAKPPPPKHRHGKAVTPKGPQIVSFADFTPSFSSPTSQSVPIVVSSASPTSSTRTDLNKPLPLPPRPSSHGSVSIDKDVISPRRSLDTPVDVAENTTARRIPPTIPLARRASRHGTLPPLRSRSDTQTSSTSAKDDNDARSIAESFSSGKAAPPPPPKRRSNVITIPHNFPRDDETSSLSLSRTSSLKSPPPVPAQRNRSLSQLSSPSLTSVSSGMMSPPPPPPPRRSVIRQSSKGSIDMVSPLGSRRVSQEVGPPSFDSDRRGSMGSILKENAITEEPARDEAETGSTAPSLPVREGTKEEMQEAKDILADMEAFQREIDELKKKFEEGR